MNKSISPSYQQLLDEIARLNQENAQLRSMLGLAPRQPLPCAGYNEQCFAQNDLGHQYGAQSQGGYGLQFCKPQVYTQESTSQPYAQEPRLNYQTPALRQNINPINEQVAKQSNEKEKQRRLGIFESLFKGRENVFARRWVSKKGGKGYSPLCVKEKECPDYGSNCRDCPNRKCFTLNREYIEAHLTNKAKESDVIGLYPVKEDNTVFFLCADFDDKSCEFGYKEDVLTYARVAREWGIDCSIERSRSGTGAHAWIFFEENIPASEARRLGHAILYEAMNRRGQMSFKSYDRLFPNQDEVPKGGFGNLVALPLQGLARTNENSVFVDDDFKMYPDQWAFLESIKKLDTPSLKTILLKQGKEATYIPSLADYKAANKHSSKVDSEPQSKPWEFLGVGRVSKSDVNGLVNIVRANGLYFPVSALKSKMINMLKRLASIFNPAYFQALKLERSVFNKPIIKTGASFIDDYLFIPRGCEDKVKQLFEEHGIDYTIEDKTNAGSPLDVTFKGELYPEQQNVLDTIAKYHNGILQLPTGFGKTVIATALIAKHKVNTLILLHNNELMKQWKETLQNFIEFNPNTDVKENFDFINDENPTTVEENQNASKKKGRRKGKKAKDTSPFGTLKSGTELLKGKIDIAMVQSCYDKENGVKDFVSNYGMIIVDECHHAASNTYQYLLDKANAKYVYGLTATAIRYDKMQPLVFMQCGPVRMKIGSDQQRKKQSFSRVLVPRFTAFRWLKEEPKEGTIEFNELVNELVIDQLRNKQILDDVIEALNAGRRPVIISNRIKHIELLEEKLKERLPDALALKMVGSNKAKEKREIDKLLFNLKPDQKFILVASDKYVGEGFDMPMLDTLFLTTPFSFKGKLTQIIGRLHRDYEGKEEVRVYDYVDVNLDYTNSQYRKRLKTYTQEGYQLSKKNVELKESIDMIFGVENYFETYVRDIQNAKTSILITVPKISSPNKELLDIIQQKMYEGVLVRIYTKSETDLNSRLSQNGIPAIVNPKATISNVIIDRDIVWYGELNYLKKENKTNDEGLCTLRLIDPLLANSLMDHLKA